MNDEDKKWYNNSYYGFAKGFDHIKNYQRYKNGNGTNIKKNKSFKIVNSFLVLITRDGATFEILKETD